MARAFWKGAISFGLVTIPAKMYVATASRSPGFHHLHRGGAKKVVIDNY